MDDSLGRFWQELEALADRVNDRDLEDGAGDVILGILREADDRLAATQISGKRDLENAVAVLLNPRDGQVKIRQEDADLVLSALRLVSVGYYRCLMVEERFRSGRMECRGLAMRRFRERVIDGGSAAAGSPGP
ncbi:MAG TPA: hypothetical protein VMS77_05010 [Conexivisphaerales archaeon]|nr:hypothetical protein [Conexivisphaerales archaeon]